MHTVQKRWHRCHKYYIMLRKWISDIYVAQLHSFYLSKFQPKVSRSQLVGTWRVRRSEVVPHIYRRSISLELCGIYGNNAISECTPSRRGLLFAINEPSPLEPFINYVISNYLNPSLPCFSTKWQDIQCDPSMMEE